MPVRLAGRDAESVARAVWDVGAMRDDLRTYVVDHLGDPGAVLVVDETGDLGPGWRGAYRAGRIVPFPACLS
ncbi:hypothetical protein [Kribbella sp. DT2]|uniref:hypothetical protein n=1 Tax=Kribbella sp. DT2 TaxID=3393427 RepID=UPI003CED910F